jgi:hypothetical protein
MNGVPVQLPVNEMVGSELTHIGLAMHQIQLHFDSGTHLNKTGSHLQITGGWRLEDRGGNLLDEQIDPPADRKSYQIHRLLLQKVTAASVDAPKSFSLTFESGDVLTVLDDSPRYESFSLRVREREFHV